MSLNFYSIRKYFCQIIYRYLFHILCWCFLLYFISRSIMSDYFSVEPMDIEGEAACAVGPQLVAAEGEKGASVDVKRTSSHLEADNQLAITISLPKRPRCSGTSWTNCQKFMGKVQWDNLLPRGGSRRKGRE